MLQQEIGRDNVRSEFLRLGTRTLAAPVERATVEEESVVVNGRLLISIKNL